jgi:RNA polymerase sigma-70 factor (ECF subfamily)
VTEEDFKDLYARLSVQLFSYAARRLSAEQAKDVVQNTFETVWRKRDQGPADRAEWPPWVVGICRMQVLQEHQRISRKHHDNRFMAEHTHETANTELPDLADDVLETEQARWIWHQLRSTEQEIVDLAFLQILNDAEAASLLGISPSAFSTRAGRVRQRIAALYAASEHRGD